MPAAPGRPSCGHLLWLDAGQGHQFAVLVELAGHGGFHACRADDIDIDAGTIAAMNVPYAVSMVAHGVPSGPAWHDDGTMRNDTLLAFMRKVTVLPHTGFEAALAVDPQARIGKVEVRARGQVLQAQRHYRQRSPATPETRMTDEQLLAKFRHCASRVRPDTAGQIGSMIFQLERLDDIGELARLW
ncbi:MmgE/PrpD family protein [Bordetella petrii]|uniref:MmgE/PrpD family protein n=1 Tax=Bordetella petrii TaxID=94624 RepID=UPI0004B03B7B|nr:MmgE/PrpD family protein [Bordetella petrii]